jgi:hypothetical protein
LPEIELNPTENEGQYAGTYANFYDQGLYKVSIYAQDEDDSISLPAIVHVFSINGLIIDTSYLGLIIDFIYC